MATPSTPTWTPPTAHKELQDRITTIDREIQRRKEDVESYDRCAAESRTALAALEDLKVDYQNVIMLAFSKAAN